jgi:hypothetical protein
MAESSKCPIFGHLPKTPAACSAVYVRKFTDMGRHPCGSVAIRDQPRIKKQLLQPGCWRSPKLRDWPERATKTDEGPQLRIGTTGGAGLIEIPGNFRLLSAGHCRLRPTRGKLPNIWECGAVHVSGLRPVAISQIRGPRGAGQGLLVSESPRTSAIFDAVASPIQQGRRKHKSESAGTRRIG